MQVEELESWDAFKAIVGRICSAPLYNPEDHLFRGMKDATWALETTLDRHRAFVSDDARSHFENGLLTQFRNEIIWLGTAPSDVPSGDALALLARHHGVPSSWIDWSTSPYIAAYFAFSGATADRVAIWWQPRAWLPDDFEPSDLIDDQDLLRFNARALRQRGIFLRAKSGSATLMKQLDAGLIKLVVPISARQAALEELDSMTIHATSLFADYDGAARTATDRLSRRFL